MNKKFFSILIFGAVIATVLPTSKLQSENIIFDLDEVLITSSKRKAAKHLGFFDSLIYTVTHSTSLEDRVFDLLDAFDKDHPEHTHTSYCNTTDEIIPTRKGRPLPRVMCQWQQELRTNDQIMKELYAYIEQDEQKEFFKSKREKRLIKKAIRIIFDPELWITIVKPIKKGIKLVKQCKDAGHNIYILSNMDEEAMEMLQEKFIDLFELFDGMITSGKARVMKPYPNIYQQLLTSYNLNPDECFFIDDHPENITGAQNFGITGILCVKQRFKSVRTELKKHGILPNKKTSRITYEQNSIIFKNVI